MINGLNQLCATKFGNKWTKISATKLASKRISIAKFWITCAPLIKVKYRFFILTDRSKSNGDGSMVTGKTNNSNDTVRGLYVL